MGKRREESGKICGVDVSKEWLDVSLAGEAHVERLENDPDVIGLWLHRHCPSLVAFEATGGYERALQSTLAKMEIPAFRVHANTVLAFRKARRIKAKTDVIDARLIAAFAEDAQQRDAVTPLVHEDRLLGELAARRRQLVDMLHAERCRLDKADARVVRDGLSRMIEILRADIDAIEGQILARIRAIPRMSELFDLLQTIKGIGPITAMTLIADLPELGQCSGKSIASLVGLAPFTSQTGKRTNRASTGHGRASVRNALFNGARVLVRRPSPFKDFYDRLTIENGRPGKVALVALMRKLLVTANAVARDRKPWSPLTESGA